MKLLALAASILAVGASASPLAAADFLVTRYDDPASDGCAPGDCSLREAVIAADADAAADRILLSAGLYELSRPGAEEDQSQTGDLDVHEDLEILGAGANQTLLYSPGLDRILHVTGQTTTFALRDAQLFGGSNPAGAGLLASQATVVVERSEIAANSQGDGIAVLLFADLAVRDSTIAGNEDAGLSCIQSDCLLENVTLSDNGSYELSASGGATVVCRHCTLFDDFGDAAVFAVSAAEIDFANSIVQGTCFTQEGGILFSLGGNFEASGDSCSFDHPSDVNGALSPGLLALGAYGGGTRTRLPQDDAPVVGNGLAENCLPAADQTGFPRPAVGCDRGAVQTGSPRPGVPIFVDGFRQGDAEAWSGVGP